MIKELGGRGFSSVGPSPVSSTSTRVQSLVPPTKRTGEGREQVGVVCQSNSLPLKVVNQKLWFGLGIRIPQGEEKMLYTIPLILHLCFSGGDLFVVVSSRKVAWKYTLVLDWGWWGMGDVKVTYSTTLDGRELCGIEGHFSFQAEHIAVIICVRNFDTFKIKLQWKEKTFDTLEILSAC